MKATTYISNSFNKANMKRFYNKKTIITLLTCASAFLYTIAQDATFEFSSTHTPADQNSISFTTGETGTSSATMCGVSTKYLNLGSNNDYIMVNTSGSEVIDHVDLKVGNNSVVYYNYAWSIDGVTWTDGGVGAQATAQCNVNTHTAPDSNQKYFKAARISSSETFGGVTGEADSWRPIQIDVYKGASCTAPALTYNVTTDASSVCDGSTVTIGLSAAEDGVTYQLYKNGSPLGGNDSIHASSAAAFTFPAVTPADGDVFTVYSKQAYGYCSAQIDGGTPTSQTITVQAAPAISAQPSTTTAYISGSAGSLSVTTSDASGYQWQYCATSGGSYSNVADDTPTGITYSNATTATLGITAGATASEETGYYKCVVSPTAPCASDVTSDYGTLTIATPCSNPTISGQPATGGESLCENDTPTDLSITASGTTLTYQWYSSTDNSNSTSGDDISLGSGSGAQTATYTPATTPAGTLYYYCTVTSEGECSINSDPSGAIVVTAAASISGQPSNTTAIISGSATSMSVTASGASAYQWQYCATSGGSYTDVVDETPTGITYSNATTATLGITAGATASEGTGYYKCVVSPTAPCASNITSDYATATISNVLPTLSSSETLAWATGAYGCNGASVTEVHSSESVTVSESTNATEFSTSLGLGDNGSAASIHFTSVRNIAEICFYGKCEYGSYDYSYNGTDYTTLTPTTTDQTFTFSDMPDGTKDFYMRVDGKGLYIRGITFTLECTPPVVTTQAVSTIDSLTATGNGNVVSSGDGAATTGVCYNTTGSPNIDDDSYTTNGNATNGAYTSALTSLVGNTTYHLKAYAVTTTSWCVAYGDEVTFTTLPSIPATTAATSVSASGFTANWVAPASQGGVTFNYIIQMDTVDGDFSTPIFADTVASTSLTSAITGTVASSTYKYRVACLNATGIGGWSNETSISTTKSSPTVVTDSIEAATITTNLATLHGNITDEDTGVTQHGACWSTSANPTIDNSKTTLGVGSTGTYTTSISGLTANTLYYARAYATSDTTGYGDDVSFTTLPLAPTVDAATDVLGTTFTANWTAPTQGSETFTYSIEVTTSGDTGYSTPIYTNSGIASGTTSDAITGLSASTDYIYRIKCVNATGSGAWSSNQAVSTVTTKNLTLDITPNSSGTVTGNGSSLADGSTTEFATNGAATLEATAASGYGFIRWEIDGTRVSTNPYDLTMDDDKAISAIFGASDCSANSFDFETIDLPTSYTTANFTTDGTTWAAVNSRLNTSSSYSYSDNNSIRLQGDDGSIATNIVSRPVSISLWARNYNTGSGYTTTLKVYVSTDGGSSYNSTAIISETLNGSTWANLTANVNTSSENVRFKIINETSSTSTSYDICIDDVNICLGPDAVEPSLTFKPVNGSVGISLDSTLTITSDEPLYRYYPLTNSYVELTSAAISSMGQDSIAQIIWLKDVAQDTVVPATVSIDGTGQIITVDPTYDFDYSVVYRLSIMYVSDVLGNILPTTEYTQFTARPIPAPEIKVELVSTNADITSGDEINMGTLIADATTTKTLRIINTAILDTLHIGTVTVSGTGYSISAGNPQNTVVAPGDTTEFTVLLTTTTAGTYDGSVSMVTDDLDEDPFAINFTGGKATFVLPYKYQSGLTTPIYSTDTLYQDITSLTDIPAEITLNGNSSFTANANFYESYNVFQAEGNCMPNGNSALRIGQNIGSYNNGLEIDCANGVGQVTVKWCSNGYRKIKITDESNNVYEQSSSFLAGGVCYTTSTVVNNASSTTLNIEFIGPDSALRTTMYYLEITPYNAELESSAKDILYFSTTEAGEDVRIYDDVIFVSVPNTATLSNITVDSIQVSPFASVSPGTNTYDFSSDSIIFTVTAENGTTKDYTVFVELLPDYGTNSYKDTVEVSVPMDSTDQILEVIEISNGSCTVPVSGVGSTYTLHFLEPEDKPSTGYSIAGVKTVCIGSTVTYSIEGIPETNNPTYNWTITGAARDLFEVVGDTASATLTLTAPDEITTAGISLDIKVIFEDECAFLTDSDDVTIQVTDQAPDPVTSVECECASNGYLTLNAKGAGNSATSYNWNFSPTQSVVSQSDSTIVINIGTGSSDIYATVNTQNGCGITAATQTDTLDYSTATSTWTGAVNSEWDNNGNWNGRVPKACTDVIIPDVNGINAYPTISDAGECRNITFEAGGALLGITKLTYEKAYVEVDLQRKTWYTLTAPLKEMVSGDYSFNGAPIAYMRLYDTYNPDDSTSGEYVQSWTKTFKDQTIPLTAGKGFAFMVDSISFNYPSALSVNNNDKSITFPRMNTDSSLVEVMIPYDQYTGKPYTGSAVTISKNENYANRFIFENADSTYASTISVPVESGYNLVGNPIMTHLDFTTLQASNSGVIENEIKFWNGNKWVSAITDTTGNYLSSDPTYTQYKLPPMQSFLVNASTNGNLVFNTTGSHFVESTTSSLRRATKTVKNLMHITASNGSENSSLAIAKRTNQTNNYGRNDTYKIFSSDTKVPEVYTMANGKPLDINLFSELPYMTPLAIKTTSKGNVKLDFEGVESFDDIIVELVNSTTQSTIDLKATPSVEINMDNYSDGSLFVNFRSAVTTEINNTENTNNSIQIFTKGSNIISAVSNPNDLIRSVTIMSEVGKIISFTNDIEKSNIDITMNSGTSICIVKVVTENNVKISKVLIK